MILSYWIEKFNLLRVYKRPDMINFDIGKYYFTQLKFGLLIYSIMNYVFYSEILLSNKQIENNIFGFKYSNVSSNFNLDTSYRNSLGNNIMLIISILLCFISYITPLNKIFNINLIGVEEKDVVKGKYYDYYFKFNNHYDRINPMTKIQGNLNYVEQLKKNNKISNKEYEDLVNDIKNHSNNVNLIEIYYRNNKDANSKGRDMIKTALNKQMHTLQDKNKPSNIIKDLNIDFLKTNCTKPENKYNNYTNKMILDKEEVLYSDENI